MIRTLHCRSATPRLSSMRLNTAPTAMSVLSIANWVIAGYIATIPIARVAMLEVYSPSARSLAATAIALSLAYTTPAVGSLPVTVLLLALAFVTYWTEIRGPTPPVVPSTAGKVYIVTGANAGIGLETARQLALAGGHVFLGCRSMSKAREAVADITRSLKAATLAASAAGVSSNAGNGKNAETDSVGRGNIIPVGTVTLMDTPLDLSSMASVRAYAAAFLATGVPLHALVCNAGLITNGYQLTHENIESSFAANHLGHFLLTKLLLPRMADTAAKRLRGTPSATDGGAIVAAPLGLSPVSADERGRIVVLSSSLHKNAKAADAAREPTQSEYAPFPTYARCKLANLLFARKLERIVAASPELKGKIAVLSVHPGNPVTNFTSNLNGFLKYAEATFLPLMYLWRETPHAGAFSTVYAATAPEAASSGIAGVYIMDCAPARHSPEAADEAAADKLWELSEQLCARTLAAAEKK